MHKFKKGVLGGASLLGVSSALAEGNSFSLDLSAAEGAATTIGTTLAGFFTGSIATLVLTVSGAVLTVYMIGVLFRWAKKQGK